MAHWTEPPKKKNKTITEAIIDLTNQSIIEISPILSDLKPGVVQNEQEKVESDAYDYHSQPNPFDPGK